jgi:hypothetical protein
VIDYFSAEMRRNPFPFYDQYRAASQATQLVTEGAS